MKIRGVLRDALRQPSVGIIEEDPDKGLVKYGKPAGIIGCIVPATNPDLTPAGNAIYGMNAGTLDTLRRLLAAQGSVICGDEFGRADQPRQADARVTAPPKECVCPPGFPVDPTCHVLHSDSHAALVFRDWPIGHSTGALPHTRSTASARAIVKRQPKNRCGRCQICRTIRALAASNNMQFSFIFVEAQ